MGLKLGDELCATPPKLSLSSLPSLKPPPETPGGLTPPLHPMVSVPFLWEEVPGRPRNSYTSSPCKPKSVRCLELPPKMLAEAKVANIYPSPTTVLDGPRVGRSVSQKFCFEGPGPKNITVTTDLALFDGELDLEKGKNFLGAHFGSCRWTSGKGTKWDPEVSKGNFDFYDRDINVKITRFRRSRKSLYQLSYKGSRLFESFYRSVKQMVTWRHTKTRDTTNRSILI